MNNKKFLEITWKIVQNSGISNIYQYEEELLGLIFLRYISVKHEEKYQELIREGTGLENNPSSYTDNGFFYIPEEAKWNNMQQNLFNTEDPTIVNQSIKTIEEHNEKLKGTIPEVSPENLPVNKVYYLNLLTEINNIPDDADILRELFNYCLSKVSTLKNKAIRDEYTPECITKTVVELLQPKEGKIYDPCCGSGGFLVESYKLSKKTNDITLYGQEINPTSWKIARMNLFINQIEAYIGEHPEDTIVNDLHPKLKADYIMANPTFKLSWPQKELKEDKRWKYGIPPRGNADYVWIQHMLSHLSENGKMAIVLANGALIRATTEGKIRENIIKDNLIEAIISLPAKLFQSTAIPTNIWIINNNKQQEGTLFIEARELGTMETKNQRILTNEDINLLKETYDKYLAGTLEDKKGFCKVATPEDIKEQEYVLTPGRYVGFKPGEEHKTRKLGEICEDTLVKQAKIVELNKKIGELIENL